MCKFLWGHRLGSAHLWLEESGKVLLMVSS